jgi:hypothetical protein
MITVSSRIIKSHRFRVRGVRVDKEVRGAINLLR